MKRYWSNKDAVIEEAKKYSSRTEFKQKSSGAYAAAHRYGWIEDMNWLKSKNVKGVEREKRKWKTKEIIIEESKKYSSRTDFKKKSNKAYEYARKNKWLDEMSWLNNKNVFIDKVDNVYLYYFEEQNAIYVGRTIDLELRDYQHRTTTNDSVYKFSNDFNVEIPPMEIIDSGLTVTEGSEREIYWEVYYRNLGCHIINQRACGSIGCMASGKWNKKKCIEESKKYKSRSEFSLKSHSAYQKSLKNGWLDEMTWLTNTRKYPRGYWTIKEHVIEEAKKYTSKKDFENANIGAFLSAYRHGWIEEMDWLVKQKQHGKNYWNEQTIQSEASKYKTKTEFANANRAAYDAAKRMNLLDHIFLKRK